MKAIVIYFVSITVLFAACQTISSDPVRNFIPGSYVRSVGDEFSRGSDTLVLRQLQGNTYEIIKRSGIIRIREGQEQPFEHKIETWTGIYDEKDQVIHEQRKGKLISFVPKENKLLVGSSAFKKINP